MNAIFTALGAEEEEEERRSRSRRMLDGSLRFALLHSCLALDYCGSRAAASTQ